MSKRTLLLAAALAAVTSVTSLPSPIDVSAAACGRHTTPCIAADHARTAARRHDPVITAAGDIAQPTPSSATRATARMVRSIDPTVALTLGDNQYPQGEYRDYQTGYDPTWGTFRAKTRPTLGNHEYESSNDAEGYFRYFGARAPSNHYSFDVGTWHLISLDSNCGEIGGCEPGDEEYRWLRRDLNRHPAHCTLAYWHHPRWSSGEKAGNDDTVGPLLRLLYHAHADVLLVGHEHNYERFAAQTPAGERARRGIVEFVVGTGGKSLGPIGSPDDNSLVREDESYGVLRMVLHRGSYEFAFRSVLNSTFRDSGSRSCH